MGGCRCSYKNCKSATKVSENIHFFHYPVKNTTRCKQWIDNACKPSFLNLPEDQLRNKVVCELHFEDDCFSNTSRKRLVHDAIPTLDLNGDVFEGLSQDVQVLPANADGTLFTVDTESLQVNESIKVESYRYDNGLLVPMNKGESEEQVSEGTEQMVYTYSESQFQRLDNMINLPEHEASQDELLWHDPDSQQINEHPCNIRIMFGDKFVSPFNETLSADKTDSLIIQDLGILNNDNQITVFPNNVKIANRSDLFIQEQQNDFSACSKYVRKPDIKMSYAEKKRITERKYARQLKKHSIEIACIKRELLKSKVNKRQYLRKKLNRNRVMTALQNKIPPTLLMLLNLQLGKKEIKLSEDERGFLCNLYFTSPQAYNLLREHYKWTLPDPSLLKNIV